MGIRLPTTNTFIETHQHLGMTTTRFQTLRDLVKPPNLKSHTHRIITVSSDRRSSKTAERAWLIRKQALETIFVQPAILDRILLRGSPVGMYDAATQAWAGTDLRGLRDFFQAARRHRRTLIDYYYDKNAFGAQQWFSADKGAVDWNSLPQFSFQRSDVEINAARALPDLLLLFIANDKPSSLYGNIFGFPKK